MLTYDYLCTACKHTWSHESKIMDAPLKECPECHEPTAVRLISNMGGFILRGKGWFNSGGY